MPYMQREYNLLLCTWSFMAHPTPETLNRRVSVTGIGMEQCRISILGGYMALLLAAALSSRKGLGFRVWGLGFRV